MSRERFVGDRAANMWWRAKEGEAHKALLPYARTLEQRQSRYLDSFVMYEANYDPNGPAAEYASTGYRRRLRGVKENVVAIAVDTVRASIAATEILARFQTDGADWSTQRRAKLLERYIEELGKLLKVGAACRSAFFACAKKGTGVVRVYADQDKRVRVEPWMVDNILADDRECANGTPPRQLIFRQADYDCDLLCQQFPEHEDAIMKARGTTVSGWRRSRLGLAETRNDVVLVEGIRLPMGTRPDGWDEMDAKEKAASGYVPGCHAYCVEGADLLVEEWHKPHFGLATIRYFDREGSWYGGGLAERITGHQEVIDRRRLQQDRQLDYSVPTTYGSYVDQKVAVQTTTAGNFVALKGEKPVTVVPTVVGPEIRDQINDARASAIAEIGLNDMMTRGVKAPGLESGVALREAKDQGSQRFSMQEKAFEDLWLEVDVLILDACKDLGDDAPEMSRQTRYGARKLPWSEVEIDDVRVMIAAASPMNRTPAGRVQTVLELSQAGAITMDETRDLLDHPDLERVTSRYTASIKAIESDIEAMEEGDGVIPEPFVNLDAAALYATNQYLIDSRAGAPEEVLEALRAYIVQCEDMLTRASSAGADQMTAGAAPLPPADLPMQTGPAVPPMAMPQQVPSAGPPSMPAGTGPMAA